MVEGNIAAVHTDVLKVGAVRIDTRCVGERVAAVLEIDIRLDAPHIVHVDHASTPAVERDLLGGGEARVTERVAGTKSVVIAKGIVADRDAL